MMEPKLPPLLSVDRVSVAHEGNLAVREVSLELAAGQVLAVLGPSGCGKSTLLRAIAGLEPLRSGRVMFAGRDLANVPVHRREFALMFQDGQLFAHLDVAANIAYPLKRQRVPRAQRRGRVGELLELVGLAGYESRSPTTLSGGERQRVALARALASNPRLLLLDEPLSALDASLREHLAGELTEILTAAGTTAILVTHDHEEAFAVADTLALMRHGEVVQAGAVEQVWARPVDPWAASFLGYAHVVEGPGAAGLLAAADLAAPEATGSAASRPGRLALRRSGLVVDSSGPLEAVVRQARATPEGCRVVVELRGMRDAQGAPLVLDAVTGLFDGAAPSVAPGASVRLRVDRSKVAPLP